MKVLLLKNVPKVGKKFDTVTVTPGYARNFLLPQNLAEIVTDKVLARVELERSLHDEKLKLDADKLAKKLSEFKDKVFTISEKANDKGHLFAGLKSEEIAQKISAESETEILAEYIALDRPIKEVGEYTLTITVGDQKVTCKLDVIAD